MRINNTSSVVLLLKTYTFYPNQRYTSASNVHTTCNGWEKNKKMAMFQTYSQNLSPCLSLPWNHSGVPSLFSLWWAIGELGGKPSKVWGLFYILMFCFKQSCFCSTCRKGRDWECVGVCLVKTNTRYMFGFLLTFLHGYGDTARHVFHAATEQYQSGMCECICTSASNK